MGLFDFLKKDRGIKSNFENTMDVQKHNVSVKKVRVKTKKKKPDIQILFSEMSKIEKFEDVIAEYYETGYKLTGSVSMHGSALCATLIKE